MRKTILRKLACIGLLVAAAAVSACGSANKVAVVDVQKVQQDSAKIQAIQKEITDKNAEIQNRLTTDSQAGLSDEDKGTGSAAGENDFCTKQTETDPVNGGNTKRGCCKRKEYRHRYAQAGRSCRRSRYY